MKLATVVSALLIGTSLLFSSTEACESACQTGISKAFGDKYGLEVGPQFDKFKNNLASQVLAGVDFSKLGSSSKQQKVKNNVPVAIKSTMDKFKSDFIGSLQDIAFNSIFVQSPPYKGDCNHPKLVIQPKKGVPWKRSDCVKQTYLCGNPPAICHDIEIIKQRIFTNINLAIAKNAGNTGPYFSALHNAVGDAASKAGVSASARKNILLPTVDSNIQKALATFVTNFKAGFCPAKTCDKYNDSIIDLLLSFP